MECLNGEESLKETMVKEVTTEQKCKRQHITLCTCVKEEVKLLEAQEHCSSQDMYESELNAHCES